MRWELAELRQSVFSLFDSFFTIVVIPWVTFLWVCQGFGDTFLRYSYKRRAISEKCIIKCNFSFFQPLSIWSGVFILIASFPDHCLLVPFCQIRAQIQKFDPLEAVKKEVVWAILKAFNVCVLN